MNIATIFGIFEGITIESIGYSLCICTGRGPLQTMCQECYDEKKRNKGRVRKQDRKKGGMEPIKENREPSWQKEGRRGSQALRANPDGDVVGVIPAPRRHGHKIRTLGRLPGWCR